MFCLKLLLILSVQTCLGTTTTNTTRRTNSDFYRIFKPKEYSYSDKFLPTNSSCDSPLKKLPGGIIVGVKKSGTYALLRYLSINPQIRAALKINNCDLNEIHYFDHDVNYQKGLGWYKSKMPNICLDTNEGVHGNGVGGRRRMTLADVLVMEKTPGYFRSLKAIERIHHYDPRTKIVLIVRDPVHRIQSELTHCATRQKNRHLEDKCQHMNKYFERVLRVSNLSWPHAELEANKFIRNSIYYLDVLKWIGAFGLKNIYVVNGENFIRTPWVELNKLEAFLGVNSYIQKRHFHFDAKKNFFCMKETNSTNARQLLEPDGCLGKNKGRKTHVYLSDFVKTELRKYFVKWNRLFFKLIGKTFDW